MKQQLIRCWKIIKQYLGNCSVHGVRYLVDDNLSYVERLFWLIFCVLCWVGCADTIMDVVRNYINSPVAVSVETTYLDWKTPFPSVAFCIPSSTIIRSKYFKRNPGMLINYSNPSLLKASTEELLTAYENMKAPCEKFLFECSWNNVKFNCCSEFQELKKTGIGYCLIMNTFHVKKNSQPSVRFFVNRTVKYGDLNIDILYNSDTKKYLSRVFTVHVFNNLNLPSISNIEKDPISIRVDKTTRIEVQHILATVNEDRVKKVAPERRRCRFMHENRKNSLFDIYSSESCYLEMIIEQMIKFCGCVHFYYFIPPGARACNGTEMLCIIANKTKITSQSEKNERCLSNCEKTAVALNRLEPHEYGSPAPSCARIHITLLSHPTVRFRRYVVNDSLDVVVAVGSAIGLFMGVSILSIFEIPYWLFVRRDKLLKDGSLETNF